MKYILILLDYDDLNTLIGPFDTYELAEDYYDIKCRSGPYNIEALESPIE